MCVEVSPVKQAARLPLKRLLRNASQGPPVGATFLRILSARNGSFFPPLKQ